MNATSLKSDVFARAAAITALSLAFIFGPVGVAIAFAKVSKIDTVAPTITTTVSHSIFSPNASAGVKDSISIDTAFSESSHYIIAIKDASGTTVMNWIGTATNPIPKIWDGRNNLNVQVSEGTYVIVVTATDAADNTATDSSHSVIVDNISPSITVAPHSTEPTNQNIVVTASSNEGTLDFSSHEFSENGSFNFVATDAAGNSTTKIVTITNIDKVVPVIALVGTSPVTVGVGSEYSDVGATATDNIDGNLTTSIATVNSVNTSVPATYTVTYNVSDSAGNSANQVTRTVTVNPSDVSALTATQTIAQGLITINAPESTTPGQHVVGSLNILSATLTATNATDADAQSVVNGQVSTLNDAINAYNAAIVLASNLSALTDEIVTANVALVGGIEGSIPGNHVVGSSATLTDAITAAGLVTDAEAQSVVDGAVTTLTNAVSAFSTAVVPTSSMTAYDAVLAAVTQANYTTASWTTYQAVVSANVVTNQNTQTAVNAATSAITTAQSALVLSVTSATILLTITTSGEEASTTITSATKASTTTDGIATTVDISSGTIITGPSTWDGTLTLPVATTTYTLTANSGNTASAALAIEVGAGDTPLTFNQAVKLTFVGQAGKLIGWSQAGVFHQITTTCNSATNPTLATGTDCKIDVGSDLVVWTKHFSTFIAYTETPVISGGGSSSGSNGSLSYATGGGMPNPLPGTTMSTVTPTVTTITSNNQGQVLSAATYNFTKNLTVGSHGTDVTALQKFLSDNKFFSEAPTGYFGQLTKKAVIAFQTARGIAQLGNVGPLTRAELNKGIIATISSTTQHASSGLTATQGAAILGLLQSFNADASVIANVKISLGL